MYPHPLPAAKAFALVIFTCLIGTKALSQDKGYIGLGFGGSTPLGTFASTEPDNEDAGFATIGLSIDLSFGYKLGERFGLAALIRSQANGVDAQAIADQLVLPGYKVTVEAGNYAIGGFFVGGYGSFPISGKLDLDTRGLIGFASTSSPTYDIRYSAMGVGDVLTFKQTSATGGAFAYNLGAGLRWNVGRKVCLVWMLDYMGTNPEFEFTLTNIDGTTTRSRYNQPIATFNSSISIGYRFGSGS